MWRVTRQQWDDEVPQEMVQKSLVWSADLPRLESINIPRSYFSGLVNDIELHMPDRCETHIFSVIAFLRDPVRTPTGEEKTELAFVLVKSRVAPMKLMTVPKLNLRAVLLAGRILRICYLETLISVWLIIRPFIS